MPLLPLFESETDMGEEDVVIALAQLQRKQAEEGPPRATVVVAAEVPGCGSL